MRKFFKLFSNFSKTTGQLFLFVFGPLTRVVKTSFEKIVEKKAEIFPIQKFRNFFFLRKNFAPKKFPKDFLYKIFIKGFPLQVGADAWNPDAGE